MSHSGSATQPQAAPENAAGVRHPVIVVGLDGSPTSWDAFAWAAGEATRGNGTLTAVYATPWVEQVAAFGAPFDYAAAEQAWQEVAEQLHDEAEQRIRGLGLYLEFVREHGDAAQALTRVARSAHADLIVMASRPKYCTSWPGRSAGGSCRNETHQSSPSCPDTHSPPVRSAHPPRTTTGSGTTARGGPRVIAQHRSLSGGRARRADPAGARETAALCGSA